MNDKIYKFENETRSKTFRIKPVWYENHFELTIIENTNAWSANVTKEVLTKLAYERRQDFTDYYTHIKECFTSTKEDLMFDLLENDARFVIKQIVRTSLIIFFITDLQKLDYQNIVCNLLDEVIRKNEELTSSIKTLQEEKCKAIQDREVYEHKLQEFVDMKTNWENEMYSSFLLLLNEKKKRIRHLTELLQSKNKTPFSIDVDVSKINLAKPVQKMDIISDSESDIDYQTDDEIKSDKCDIDDVFDVDVDEMEQIATTSKTASLPKRNKIEKAPSKAIIFEESKIEKPEEMKSNYVECTPVLDFSTQDLLDRM